VAGRLFELYFSTKSQGTGLGLAICRSLLDRMGGRIALADRVDGGGAVAAVTLPRAPQGSDRAGTGGEEVGEDERRS
jgi:signal transduction histidine kinase